MFGIDDELDDFNDLLADKRHREIISVLTGIHSGLSVNKTVEAIEKQRESIEKLLTEIEKEKEMNKLIPINIMTISRAILKKIEDINTQRTMTDDRTWKFDIKRGRDGLIQEVTAKQI